MIDAWHYKDVSSLDSYLQMYGFSLLTRKIMHVKHNEIIKDCNKNIESGLMTREKIEFSKGYWGPVIFIVTNMVLKSVN